ncbi:chemotaxis-specific protein-glutamate methyltransferase CheB [Azospirillum halopraeferens]|uniref:chemotaxis-specific protein-glutamate methyltransferase CheB n=1 Tax=Azospirillum halopraeferens TaxID=34010 RepID=UPI00041B4495|nr:chemotaxis-specific protein-glutamate methyltransferase CheB [Azospirillum halopraeferens]
MKVLIVDDSALARRLLVEILSAEGDMEVAAARSGTEALAEIVRFDPDVVTLDVTMPGMDGLACLRRIMVEHPKPVLMISGLTAEGAETTVEALRLGAVDVVQKPGGSGLGLPTVRSEIVAKVRAAAGARLRRSRNLRERLRLTRERIIGDRPAPVAPAEPRRQGDIPRADTAVPEGEAPAADVPGVVLVGVSTGGPGALEEILPLLPAGFPWPVVVAQHMPQNFTATLARRLDDVCAVRVVEAALPVPLEPGIVVIARGGADAVLAVRGGRLVVAPVPVDTARPWHPSVDRLVESALRLVRPDRLVGVQLTGMGSDGAAAMADLHARGGRTIAESEESAVVFGMPHELIRRGGADAVLAVEDIAAQLTRWLPATGAR